jgi:hypothetical protein
MASINQLFILSSMPPDIVALLADFDGVSFNHVVKENRKKWRPPVPLPKASTGNPH